MLGLCWDFLCRCRSSNTGGAAASPRTGWGSVPSSCSGLTRTSTTAALAQAIDLAKDFKIPGGDMPGIFYLRDVVDADKLVAAIQDLKKTDGKARAAGPPFPYLHAAC